MAEERDLEQQVRDLERRLARYHEQMEEALEHDRQFQLKATWGFVNGAVGGGAFLAVLWGAERLGFEGWFLGALSAIAALIAFGVASAWSDKGRTDDQKKLARLPKWEPKW